MRMHRRIPAVAEGAPQSAHGGERVPVDAGEGKYLRLRVDGAHLFGKIAGNAPCGRFGAAASLQTAAFARVSVCAAVLRAFSVRRCAASFTNKIGAAACFIHKKIKAEPLFGGEAHVV